MLRGYTVGITADRRSDEQAALFERRGATVLHAPTIRTLPLGSDERLRSATDEVIRRRPRFTLVSTALGFRSWFSQADTWGLGDALHDAVAAGRVFGRGPKAAGAIHAHGMDVAGRAASERLVDAVDLVLEVLDPGDVVAFVLDGSDDRDAVERLRDGGATVVAVPVYRWELPEDRAVPLRLVDGLLAGRVHAVTFTAGPAARNLVSIAKDAGLGGDLRAALADGPVVGCVGPVCAETTAALGVDAGALVVPDRWRLGPLVRAVAGRLARRTVALDVGGNHVEISGSLVHVDGEPVALTDTEARVLSVLAAKPNVVHAKVDLLRLVWRDENADPHVVEAAVTRMRRRLGPLGGHVTSVYRRGYALRT